MYKVRNYKLYEKRKRERGGRESKAETLFLEQSHTRMQTIIISIPSTARTCRTTYTLYWENNIYKTFLFLACAR